MTTTPTPAAPSLAFGEDTGASDSDGVINLSGPLLIGQTVPNATITLYDNNVATTVNDGNAGAGGVASTVADANGFYTILPDPALDDGKHMLTITATAPGEAPSQYSAPLSIVVDTSVPDPPTALVLAAGFDTGSSARDGVTAKQSLQLAGTSEPGAVVRLYNGDNTTPLAQATVAANGSYTLITGMLADAAYTLTVTATDLAGNISTRSAASSVTIDSMAPAAPAAPTLSPGTDTGASHTDGLTSNDTPVVVGTAEANATVELYDGATMIGKAMADGTGAYTITSDKLDDGAHALTVKAVDAAGNVGAASAALNVVVDTAGPTGTSTPAVVDLGAGSVPFTVHFSEPVTGVTAADFTLVATNTVSGSVQSVSGSGADYTVTVSGLDGQGTVGLALVAGSVTDLAGNAATLTESDTHPVSGTTQPTTIEVSTDTSGLLGTGTDPSLSASGRLVAFTTLTVSLTTGPATDGVATVVVRDTVLGKTALVSYDLDGATANGSSGGASISADGTEIAFASDATNLIDGGTTPGETNVYIAKLTEGPDGPDVKSITLVSDGNDQQGEGVNDDGTKAFSAPILSADGSTVAFDSTQALVAGAESGTENVYAENVATGAIKLVSGGTGMDEYGYTTLVDPIDGESYTALVPQPDKTPGTGGDMNSDVTSVSADGKLIAYESTATDLGGSPVTVTDEVVVPSRGYIFDTVTGDTTNVDGTDLLNPSATADSGAYNTYDPVLSADGTKVFYAVHYVAGVQQVQELYEDTLATGVTTPISVGGTANNYEVYDFGTSASKGGGLVLFQDNPGLYSDQPGYQAILDNVSTGTMTALSPGFAEALTSAGNAYVFSEEPNGVGSDQLYETNLGVSVGIDPISGDDAVGASVLAKAASGSGLAVTGTTNAPRGTTVAVQLFGASATTNTLNSPAVLGTVDGFGHWSATVPTALLQSADGNYALVVQVGTPTGNSFLSVRDFTVDTVAPAAPDAPKLDAGSDSSLASDGSATNQAEPTLTGTAEAGATVTLYDSLAGTTQVAVGTATADGDGVYALTPDKPLLDGKHTLDVTATDAAGNVSAASADLSIAIDTEVPKPPTLTLSPGSDTGTSDSDEITNNAGPTVIGTGEAGTQITLYDTDGIAMLGTATVKADGTWSLDSSNLSDGVHTLTATDTDKAGNVSAASTPLAVTIDTLPPLQPTISSVTGPLVSGKITALVTVNGTAEPGSKVTLVLDGGMGADSVFGESTAESDGAYSISSDPLAAGDGQNLTVIATDVAGNASQPSMPVDVDITNSATPPPGVPPFTPTLIGLLTDGPIGGATVFTDTNGNGTRDTDEGSGVTDATGRFQLIDTGGELIATGGTDTTTGLSLPGALTAPAHSTVIDPLTTLLDAYIALTGDSETVANAAVAAALGLLGGGGTDLTMLDPNAAALSGSSSLDPAVADGTAAIANAKLADLAVDYTSAISRLITNRTLPSGVFADVFTVLAGQIAALPSGGMLDLDDPITLLAAANATASLAGSPIPPISVTTAAEQIVAAGDAQLDADAAQEQGHALLTGIAGVEAVEQGAAATTLGQIGANPTLAASLVTQYTGAPLTDQASFTAALITDAPRLAAGSDQGVSTRDNITDDLTPTFVGTAVPGTFVTLLQLTGGGLLTAPDEGLVLGNAQADATGHYSIASAMLSLTDDFNYEIAAVGAATDQNLAVGSLVPLPQGVQPQSVFFELPGESDDLRILAATPAASAGNDSGDSALQLSVGYFVPDQDGPAVVQVFADGGTTPIASGIFTITTAPVSLITTPLSLGSHALTVTATLRGGTVIAGNPSFDVNVTAPAVADGTARAVGVVVGGTVTDQLATGENGAVPSTTGGDGTYAETVASGISPTTPLTLTGGYDAVTGLPIGGVLGGKTAGFGEAAATLTAPNDYSAINPFTSIVADIENSDYFDFGPPDAGDIADYAAETLSAFGIDPDLDLATLDPLEAAQAGDTAPLLASIKLLDTETILAPLIGFTFQTYADVIDDTEGLPFDLDDPATIASAIASYVAASSNILTAQQVSEVVAIVAAGNAAIDAHAAAATSLADTLSYAFAAERVEQVAVASAVSQGYQQAGNSDPDSLPAAVAAYTGTALDQAIQTERGQTTQAVSLLPQGPASTGAPSVTFAISFSKPVTGLAAASFQLVVGAGLQDAAITGVTAVAGSGGESYDVTVSTGIGQGTLALTYLGGSVESGAGEPVSTGAIAPPTTYLPLSTPGAFTSIAVGDFNGDARPDAVLLFYGNGFSVTPYLNTGGGTFQAEAPLSIDAGDDSAISPIVTDVNGDGKADILVADQDVLIANGDAGPSYGDAVTVLLGNGDGSFQQPINTLLDFVPTEMVAGDFNGDGKIDIALTDDSGMVHILLGNGAGGFTPVSTFAGGDGSFDNESIAVGDFNGDGRLDLAVSEHSPDTTAFNAGTVSIFLGNGDGTFTAGPVLDAGIDPVALAVGDLNHDGIADIAVADGQSDDDGTSSVTVLLGNGDGTFTAAPPVTLDASSTHVVDVTSIAIGDIDDDGNPDLVLGGGYGTSANVSVLLGNGDGTFRLGSENFNGGGTSSVALADVNGDGRTDILAPGDDSGANAGLDVFLNEPETVVGSTSPSVTIDRPAIASPALSDTGGGGTFSHVGNAYTLDLGTVAQNSNVAAVLALLNAAAAPADSFDGNFSSPSGSGFVLTGATLAATIAAGQSQNGITFTADTSSTGIHSETITFAPRDTTAIAAETTVPDDDSGTIVPQTAPSSDPVADELPALTFTIMDDVVAGATMAPAILAPVAAIALPDVRVGGVDSEAVTISNSATPPAADLDVTATAFGDATVAGSVSGLAPLASDSTSLVVGLTTNAAGAQTGTVTLLPVSEPDTALTDQIVAVSGSVFREAAASIAPIAITVHVGDPGSIALPVVNTDPADGFSEALIATITGVTTGLSIASAGPTADIVAGATDTSSLAIGFSTATAQTITGSASVALTSDGGTGAGSVDGLGQAALVAATVPITITVDNYAQPTFTSNGGMLTPGATPGTWILNLGTAIQGAAALSADLDVLNGAQGPADLLGGSFTVNAATGFTNGGFGGVGDIGAGNSADAGSVSLQTTGPGTFTETVTLSPTDTAGAGTPTALTAQTVTITGTIAPPTGVAQGDVHIVTFDGLHYNFQATGDFVLARSTQADNPSQIQMHAQPWQSNPNTSVATEIAARVGNDVVSFGVGSSATTVSVNGIADTAIGSTGTQQLLGGGHLQALSGTSFVLTWDTGETLTVTQPADYLSISATLAPQDGPGSVQGLLGPDTGQQNDFQLPDGAILSQPLSTATLLSTFADAWTVAPGQSLLSGTTPAAAGLGAAPAMTFLSAAAPGQILTGSLQSGGQTGAPVIMVGALADFAGDTLINFAVQDRIDVTDVGTALARISFTAGYSGDILTIGDGSVVASLRLPNNLSGGVFQAVSDHHGGTLIGYV